MGRNDEGGCASSPVMEASTAYYDALSFTIRISWRRFQKHETGPSKGSIAALSLADKIRASN